MSSILFVTMCFFTEPEVRSLTCDLMIFMAIRGWHIYIMKEGRSHAVMSTSCVMECHATTVQLLLYALAAD